MTARPRRPRPRSRRRVGRAVSRGRLVVHGHFYQPSRVDPFSGAVPADPSAAPAHDWNARVSEECYRPNAERGNLGHMSWDLGPTLADWLVDGDPLAYRGVRRGRPRDQRDRPAIPSRDPAARVGGRPADRDPLGHARLRGALRPAGHRDVAARDRGRPADPPDARRSRHPLDDPRALAGQRAVRRDPPALPCRARRWPRHPGGAVRRGPVGRHLVRAARHVRCRSLRPGRRRAAPGIRDAPR